MTPTDGDRGRAAFVCVETAGRSQMAHAFAERMVVERGLETEFDLVTGGTDPATSLHDNVVAAMADVGVDFSGRTPRKIGPEDLNGPSRSATVGAVVDE